MKCHQCNSNAMFQVGEQKIPLCLSCHALMQQTLERNVQMLREEQNHAMDNIDAIFGISTGGRYPIKRPVVVSGGTVNHNHIAITNSQIGILNTGSINNLNQTIDNLYSASEKNLADSVRLFSETVLADKDLDNDQKTQILESVDTVTKELFQKPENRKKSVVNILLNGVASTVQFAANSLSVWQVLYPLLKAHF